MELVIAAIGLSVGILTPAMYAIVVLIAIVTTVVTAPLLKLFVDRARSAVPDQPVARDEGHRMMPPSAV